MTRRRWTPKQRAALFMAHGGACHLCGERIEAGEAWEISHDLPLALGGADDETNCFPAHATCHRDRTSGRDVPMIAKADRQKKARETGRGRKAKGRGFTGWRRFDGTIVRRS